MGFICWAWRDSLKHHTSLLFLRGSVGNIDSGAWAEWAPTKPSGSFEYQRGGLSVGIAGEVFPAPFNLRGGAEEIDEETADSVKKGRYLYLDRRRFRFRFFPTTWRL